MTSFDMATGLTVIPVNASILTVTRRWILSFRHMGHAGLLWDCSRLRDNIYGFNIKLCHYIGTLTRRVPLPVKGFLLRSGRRAAPPLTPGSLDQIMELANIS